ncbi:MAG: putative translation initiation factor SUI1 [Saprospiraceae bacterium]
MPKNNNSSLSWDAFQSLGNPENAPELPAEDLKGDPGEGIYASPVRVYVERKGRKGKTVTLIKGLFADEDALIELCKKLKSLCGVGGGVEEDDIMMQGDQRVKIINKLKVMGFSDIKNAGM